MGENNQNLEVKNVYNEQRYPSLNDIGRYWYLILDVYEIGSDGFDL